MRERKNSRKPIFSSCASRDGSPVSRRNRFHWGTTPSPDWKMSAWSNGRTFPTLVYSCTAERTVFIKRLRPMAGYPHRLLVVTSTLSQVKSPYDHAKVDPNRVMQFLIATLAALQVPFVCSETLRYERAGGQQTKAALPV
jgi:hypothetical protein